MRALLFGTEPDPLIDHPILSVAPMGLRDLDDPTLLGDDWVVLRPRLTGICGSDLKQVALEGEPDNAMTAVISFPQVLGHEVVADVVEAGPAATVAVGQRVVVNPWLSCAPRGLDPCPACIVGDLSLCHRFTGGCLDTGIHVGNSSTATGGFAELMPVHDSMCHVVPEGVSDETAVLADPFSVSLHAVLHNPPPPDGRVIVWGVGALGTTTMAILQALRPDVTVMAVVEHEYQAAVAERFGAKPVAHQPDEAIVNAVAAAFDGQIRRPFVGTPFLHPGGADVIYDTVGSPATLEVGVRVTRARGTIAITGVADPGRFEWTPWYFKELRLVGSNAFGIEEVDGVRAHALDHYLQMVDSGRVDVTSMLTHTFKLDHWTDAFRTLMSRSDSHAVKVAFDQRDA